MSELLQKATEINLKDFHYPLAQERIAKYPLEQRDHSKLLVYKNKKIHHEKFYSLQDYLPQNSCLIFNNTKVIPARIQFRKSTGASIEIFLLSPASPTSEVTQAMLVHSECVWNCIIGNRKRWKSIDVLERHFMCKHGKIKVSASFHDYKQNQIQFKWDNESIPFVEIVELMGTTPLPPYLNRSAGESDKENYQTVYSKNEGAVAAPTAGLHFTNKILAELKDAGHAIQELTLHVGAGTFQPIKVENVLEHTMHCEQISIEKQTIDFLATSDAPIIAVGTTSVRSLESAYWFGVHLLTAEIKEFHIKKLYPYEVGFDDLPTRKEAYKAILNFLNQHELTSLYGDTEIFIFPGYQFQVIDGLITNFHQPESTLMLLIAAFTGQNWKMIYNEALDKNYRFLSYGDSSILLA